ncbi:MAG: RNA chaperone Hfq [Gemmatimonadaceae bacterium]|nr:RNA chaperone Hfq [Gloeobacterales cyanobacterium ES-bin-141]
MAELDLSAPSTRFLQKLIRERTPVEIKLHNGDILSGLLRWQDAECLAVETQLGEMILWRTAVTYIRQTS